ncbi:hypothetical protein B0H10DRAFT_32686 [Mycena sp. CBHHK59/15]|nr:hypothetical protein B0H10DRAFT_32686 [Mycena sp. CBHHK59/15]
MFTLCRSSLRLATSRPFLRPPRISAGYAGQVFHVDPALPTLAHLLVDLGEDTRSHPAPLLEGNPFSSLPAPISLEAAPAHRLHCHSTKTNTINTFTDPDGNAIAWFSGGSCGFKKRNRSTYEAGYQCAVRMFAKIEEELKGKAFQIDLFCKGFGQGRDALFKALMTSQGDQVRSKIVSITDRTPIKIGGTRSKKRKRR